MEPSSAVTAADTRPVLQRLPGTWQGTGLNHENERFHAVLVARPLFASGGVLLWFRATGDDGTVYHEELAVLGPDDTGALVMAAANTNLPFVQRFEGPAPAAAALAVHHGDFGVDAGFRETIRLAFDGQGSLTVAFDWALPGEAMAERSAVALSYRGLAAPPDSPLR